MTNTTKGTRPTVGAAYGDPEFMVPGEPYTVVVGGALLAGEFRYLNSGYVRIGPWVILEDEIQAWTPGTIGRKSTASTATERARY